MENRTTEDTLYLQLIGQRIKERREKKDLNQTELAALLRTSKSQIIRIEKGEISTSILMLKKMATLLNVTIEKLVKDN